MQILHLLTWMWVNEDISIDIPKPGNALNYHEKVIVHGILQEFREVFEESIRPGVLM